MTFSPAQSWWGSVLMGLLSAVMSCSVATATYAQSSSLLTAPLQGSSQAGVRLSQPVGGSAENQTVPFLRSRRSGRPGSSVVQAQFRSPGGSNSRFNGSASRGATALPAPIDQQPRDDRPVITLDQVNWAIQPPLPQRRPYQKNDIITIRVDEITRVAAEGASENRKQTIYEAVLTDWIRLTNFRLRPDLQPEGDPTVGTESNANFRAQSTVESREALAFNVAATVVDIRPNGLLVLEARKLIRVNDNLWETALMGTCRADDIGPDNVVLSRDLVDLEIHKNDRGHLRDGYKRGWFQKWFDRISPF